MSEFIVFHRMGSYWNLTLVEAETTDEAIRDAEQYMSDLVEVTEIRSIPVSAMVETVRSEVA